MCAVLRKNGDTHQRIKHSPPNTKSRRERISKTGWRSAVSLNSEFRFCSGEGSSAVPGSTERELPKPPAEKHLHALVPRLASQRDSRSVSPRRLPPFGPQTRCFLVMAGRRENIPDWLAERSQFELVGPFCKVVILSASPRYRGTIGPLCNLAETQEAACTCLFKTCATLCGR